MRYRIALHESEEGFSVSARSQIRVNAIRYMLQLAVYLCLGLVSIKTWAADGTYRYARTSDAYSHAQNLVPAVVPLKTSETKEALAFANDYLTSHLSRCGNAIFIKLRGGYKDLGYMLTPFGGIANTYQLIELRISVQPLKAITDIDKLNGLQWLGQIAVTAKAARPLLVGSGNRNEEVKKWGEWYDATISPVVEMKLEKRQGEWVIGSFKLAESLACDEIPLLDN